jgi:hypothetical protein
MTALDQRRPASCTRSARLLDARTYALLSS